MSVGSIMHDELLTLHGRHLEAENRVFVDSALGTG